MNVVQGILSAVSPLPDGDKVDRYSYCLTTVGLVVASAFVSGWSFVGSPIQCWFPAYYKGWWMEYALDYCYVQNTYFVPFFEKKVENAFDFGAHMVELPSSPEERQEKQIGYYQWVPFILAFQALLFYAPILIWRAIYECAGFKIRAICDTCAVSSNMDEGERSRNMEVIANFLTKEQSISRELGGKLRKSVGGGGGLIIASYLLTKLLFAVNALAQFAILQSLLGVSSPFWGWNVAKDIFTGNEWPQTGNFPRVTYCDFTVRVLGNMHNHTVQCVLMINMFNEKIFVGLWFWLCFMVALTCSSLIYWMVTSSTMSYGRNLIRAYVNKIDDSVVKSHVKQSLLDEFIAEKLHPDGVFLLRLVASNSGDNVACALVQTMWKSFANERSKRPPPYMEPLLMSKKPIDERDL